MPTYTSELLGEGHDLAAFDSGAPDLDRWLTSSALHAQAMRTARTFVWHRGDDRVLAYFTLAAHLVRRHDIPGKIGRGSPEIIPAVLLARLALDRNLHGHGHGEQLLVDALSRAVDASELVGARLVVVDALHEQAAGFYEHFGFARFPGDAFRLVRKMSDIAAALRR